MKIPSVGRMVHYVSYGTPGGEYSQRCRAAIVTEVGTVQLPSEGGTSGRRASLCVLNPTGQFFNLDVPYDPGTKPRTSLGIEMEVTEMCDGLEHDGGTWHWPEMK